MSKQPVSNSVSHQLAQICRLNRGLMHNLVRGIGLHQGQPYVLELLWQQDGRTHSELGAHLHVSAATISNTIKRMEKAGFVERRADAEDDRVSRVYLTDAGRNIQNEVQRLWQAFEMQALDDFTIDEVTLFQTLLEHLYHNLLNIDESDLLSQMQN